MSNPRPVEGARELVTKWRDQTTMTFGGPVKFAARKECADELEAVLSAAAPAPKGPRRITQEQVDAILLEVVGERWHQAKRQLIADHINELVGAAAPARDGVREALKQAIDFAMQNYEPSQAQIMQWRKALAKEQADGH